MREVGSTTLHKTVAEQRSNGVYFPNDEIFAFMEIGVMKGKFQQSELLGTIIKCCGGYGGRHASVARPQT